MRMPRRQVTTIKESVPRGGMVVNGAISYHSLPADEAGTARVAAQSRRARISSARVTDNGTFDRPRYAPV
jgi:hypothetical protein